MKQVARDEMEKLYVFATLLLIVSQLSYSLAQTCGGNYTRQGYFTSPNYPRPYPASAFCRYNITSSPGKVVQLTFKDFSTEPRYDLFRCYNSLNPSYALPYAFRYNGEASGQVYVGGNATVCLFNSDATDQYRGFNITFTSVAPPSGNSVTGVPTTTAAPPRCGGTVSGSGSIRSPGYPSQYPANVKCQWQITSAFGAVIQLQLASFQTESLWDSLRISCTNTPTSLLAQYSGSIANNTRVVFPCNLTLSFTTDGSVQQAGFNITYTTVANSSAVTANSTRASLLLPSSCGVPAITPAMTGSRIVGGQPAIPNSWPWHSMLRRNGNGICGGSLITNQWVVTAAHCIAGKPAQNLSVTFGKHNTTSTVSGEVTVGAIAAIMYPSYDGRTNVNDIALVKLTSPVTFTRSISPICLPSVKLEAGSSCYITGWGTLTENGIIAKVLMQVSVPTVESSTCCQYLPSACYKSMVCAGVLLGGKDACQGDSGGPMARLVNGKFELAAVTSWGYGCAAPFKPAAYTNVYGFEGWILDTIAKN